MNIKKSEIEKLRIQAYKCSAHTFASFSALWALSFFGVEKAEDSCQKTDEEFDKLHKLIETFLKK